jgi:hypothetical protein
LVPTDPLSLSQPHPGAAVVFVDELDRGGFQSQPYFDPRLVSAAASKRFTVGIDTSAAAAGCSCDHAKSERAGGATGELEMAQEELKLVNNVRRQFIGGSAPRITVGTDEAALLRLWREKRAQVGPEDLSSTLVVQLGLATEDLNRRWYEANTGQALQTFSGGSGTRQPDGWAPP